MFIYEYSLEICFVGEGPPTPSPTSPTHSQFNRIQKKYHCCNFGNSKTNVLIVFDLFFQDLSSKIKSAIEEILNPLEANTKAKFFVTVKEFQPGSVVVNFRLVLFYLLSTFVIRIPDLSKTSLVAKFSAYKSWSDTRPFCPGSRL